MALTYTIVSPKSKGLGRQVQVQRRHRKQIEEPPKPKLKLVRDETGAIIRVPKLNPKRLEHYKDEPLCLDGEPAYWGGISREDLDRMQRLLDPKGHVMSPKINLKWGDSDRDAARKFWMEALEAQAECRTHRPRKRLSLPRHGVVTPRPSEAARGDEGALEEQAAHYLRIFDHELAQIFDEPEFTLLKVVCNLRNYFGMSQDQTVMLMVSLFNPKTHLPWSRVAIVLAWELVAGYTPWLGLDDPVAIADQKRSDLDDEVTELLAYTREGGRVTTEDFYKMLKKWNPDLDVKKTAVTQAVKRITGIEATGYRDGKCFPGFHLPTEEELMDIHHHAGLDVGAIEIPERPIRVVPLIPLMTLTNACARAS